ncbi:MAG: Exo-glucosaminidase LytG precursor [Bacteroidota bacterium]|jgi:LysM repeat protein
MRYFLFILIVTLANRGFAQKQTPTEYIDKFKDLAIIEMHRSGVPASITLAQGVLESNSGNSRLAKYANNHFGIKCKGDWTGNVIYADDDAPDECFRAYESVLESFRDHSNFLRTNWRYQTLFELDRTDYKNWCDGLRKAGYATNPNYGSILVNLIERYELHKFDLEPMPGGGLPALEMGESINGIPVRTAKPGETVSSIAADNYVKDRHIRKWNDLPEGAEINAGDIVYLKPKRRRGSEEVHTVTEGETMYQISQRYGIKLKQLYKKNRMEYGTEPKPGEVLAMQKKRDAEDAVELKKEEPVWEEPAEPKFVNPHSQKTQSVDTTKAGAIKIEKIEVPEYHEVAKGDNIYRIAERYHILEEDLMKWNNDLNPVTMKIGQKVYLSPEAGKRANKMVEAPKPTPKAETPKSDEEIENIKKEIVVDGPVYHHVVKGDTLYNICKRYNVTEEQLKKWNKLDTIVVKLGDKLQVSE